MDERLRELERRHAASGSAEDLAAYLAERLRVERDLTVRLMRRVIRLERCERLRAIHNPAVYRAPVTDQDMLDWLDEDDTPPNPDAPIISVPSVFSDGPVDPGEFSITTSHEGDDFLDAQTLTHADHTAEAILNENRVREIISDEPVRMHAHFYCMKPGCYEQHTHEISYASEVSYHTPSGWTRTHEMLLCSMHGYMPAQICEQELGGHVHPEYPPTNSTYSCTRCGYGPIYPEMLG